MNEFISQMIGSPDTETHQKIHGLYAELVDRATTFKWDNEQFFGGDEVQLETLFEMLGKKQEDLVVFLKYKYLSLNPISIPGVKIDKFVKEDGWLDLPVEYNLIISQWKIINELIDQINATYFYFPLRRLLDDETQQFKLNEAFEKDLLNFTATFTKSEKQNEMLEVVQRFCDVVNDLIELKIVKSLGRSWINVSDILERAITVDKFSERPLSPFQKMFEKYYPLQMFGETKAFVPRHYNRDAIIQ